MNDSDGKIVHIAILGETIKTKQAGIKTDLELVNKIGYTICFHGEVSEWSMVPDSKSGVRQRT